MSYIFPKYTSYGSYPVFYIHDGCAYCADCCDKALENEEHWITPIQVDGKDTAPYNEELSQHPNWENTELYCFECGTRIESAYGEDDE